jgi:hypothetical protein
MNQQPARAQLEAAYDKMTEAGGLWHDGRRTPGSTSAASSAKRR